MKTKKIPYYFLLGSLTIGASLIIGFLSFTGAMALWLIVPVARMVFGLSVAYEGEIYLENIKGALNKLGFKRNFMYRTLARRYLAEFAPAQPGAKDPRFFHDYIKALKLRSLYKGAGMLNREDRKRKKAVNKYIKKTEKWFTVLLFEQKEPQNQVEINLVNWLKIHKQDEWLVKANQRQYFYYLAAGFSTAAGFSMSFGTTYLLLEAFTAMPVILTLSPLLLTTGIMGASLIAGAAYALLTFNAITDIIDNDTVQSWLQKLTENLVEKRTPRAIIMGLAAVVLFSLAIALTICTAGTWWTVIKQTPPLFKWMSKIPSSLLMILPITNGAASLFFNFQNTAESFEMVEDLLDHQPSDSLKQRLLDAWGNLVKKETFWQRINPFRLILKLTFLPLRIILFLGHLVSIALTSDRLPGVPQIVSFLIGLICEGFEDAHYFLKTEKHDRNGDEASPQNLLKAHLDSNAGHNHDNDLPTRFLYFIFTPLFYLAAFWDYSFDASNNWELSCQKFKLTSKSMDETADTLDIDSSLHLSKLVMNALQSHIESTQSVTTNTDKACKVKSATTKPSFFGHLKPIITEKNEPLIFTDEFKI